MCVESFSVEPRTPQRQQQRPPSLVDQRVPRFISDKLQLHLQRNLCEPPLYTEPNPEASNQAASCVAILSFNPVSCSACGDCGDLLINNLFSFLLHLGKDSLAIAAQECHTPTILEQPLLEPRDPVALACPASSSHLHMRHADEARFDPRPPVETSTSTSTATATATQRRSAHACCVFGFRFLLSVFVSSLCFAAQSRSGLAWAGPSSSPGINRRRRTRKTPAAIIAM